VTPLDDRVTGWVLDCVEGARAVVGARRLTGGLTSLVHELTVEDKAGRRRRYVLRRWTGEPWPGGEVQDGTEGVRRESVVLDALVKTALPAPRLVAADASGGEAGLPTLLMTHLPGRLELVPADPDRWTALLADTAVAVHGAAPSTPLPAYETWLRLDVEVPPWSSDPGLWRDALAVVGGKPAAAHLPLIHHDFQPFNVLWSRGKVRGVVDWVWASQGPPDDDVTHCRLNLALLRSADEAWQFQLAWEARAGRRLDPWWDVAGVVDYLGGWEALELQRQAGRRMRIDSAGMRGRVESLLRHVMTRLA
jgi:aminoglycoside phosphotransferase (APT) family kinase protein